MIPDMAESAVRDDGGRGRQEHPALRQVPNRVPGYGIHEVGVARMGKDTKTSVLNQFQQTHDVKNLFVMDGSCFTSSACQNPTLTIMALAVRSSDYVLGGDEEGEPVARRAAMDPPAERDPDDLTSPTEVDAGSCRPGQRALPERIGHYRVLRELGTGRDGHGLPGRAGRARDAQDGRGESGQPRHGLRVRAAPLPHGAADPGRARAPGHRASLRRRDHGRRPAVFRHGVRRRRRPHRVLRRATTWRSARAWGSSCACARPCSTRTRAWWCIAISSPPTSS